MIRLFEKTFGHPMGPTENERHWVWEYENGPNGPAKVFVGEVAGKTVGAHGNLPLRFQVGDQRVIASSSFDSMVDSDYRGLGIFTGVVRAFQQSAYQDGFCLSYSFPNENSFPIHVHKMGRSPIEGYEVLRRHIGRKQLLRKDNLELLIWMLKTLIRARLAGAQIVPVREFDARFDALWDAAKSTVKIGIVRDSTYLNWRFAQKPEEQHTTFAYLENGELGGYIVLKRSDKTRFANGLVMDVLALPNRGDIVHALFARALAKFIRGRASQIWFGAMEHSPYTALVRQLFSHANQRLMCGQVYGDVDPAFALDAANWHISFADTDFY